MPTQIKKASVKKTQAQTRAPRVSNKVTLDANTPIPFENGGQAFSFANHSHYIPFLHPNDNFGQQLLETRLLSTTHNRCVTTKRNYCAGSGFHHSDGTDLDKQIADWFSSMNLKNEPITEINKLIFEAAFTYGNAPIEVVRFTSVGKKYLFVYVHNFLEWRLCKPNDDDIVTHAIQSKLFLKQGFITADVIKKAKKLPLYNPRNPEKKNWFKDEKGVERTLIWYKNSVTGFDHYGIPSAISSMIFQLLEYKGARYNLDNFENNMVVSALVALKGNLSQPEADRIGKKIVSTHTGDGKRGRVMVVASEEGLQGSDMHNFDTHKDGSYTEADHIWTQKIILANEWDAVLAGIISPSTLGKGSGYLAKIIEFLEKTVIKPAQADLMQKVWTHIFKIAQDFIGLPFDKHEISIKSFVSISPLTDIDITEAVQVNEVRQAVGLQEDPAKKGEYMAAKKQTTPSKKKGGENV